MSVPAGSVVLGARQWALACDLAGVAVPEDFATAWAGSDDAEAARAGALAEMTASGMIDADGSLDPLLTWLFEQLATAPLHVRVLAWAGDTVVVAHVATDLDATVGLTRLQRVHRERARAFRVEDAAAVEVASFPTSALGDHVLRLLPPTRTSTCGPPVAVSWELVVGVLDLLRVSEAWPPAVADEARRHARAELGAGDLPPLLRSLVPPLTGAVQVSAVLLPGRASASRWEGRWVLAAGERVVAVTPTARPTASAAPVLRLRDVGREGLVADVVRGLAEALDDVAALTYPTAAGGA